MKIRNKKSGFTLVELLVVISIIAILLTLAVPGINGAMKQARRTADAANVRGLGTVMFQYTIDNGGQFPGGETSTDVFQKIVDQGYLTDPSVLVIRPHSGKKPLKSGTTLSSDNVGYAVTTFAGGEGLLDTSPDQIPLVYTADPNLSLGALAGEPIFLPEPSPSGLYGSEGIVTCYKSNKSEFVRYKPGASGDEAAVWVRGGVNGTFQVTQP